MGDPSGRSTTLFVGNIPFDATEDQLLEIFSEVGPVKSLRLMANKDTGRIKGYAFCEYFDVQTAKSALRNLQNRECNGRNLRLQEAESEKGRPSGGRGTSAPPGESLRETISNFTASQVYDILMQMKDFAEVDREKAARVLAENPQLCAAVIQAQSMLGMIKQQPADAPGASSATAAGAAPVPVAAPAPIPAAPLGVPSSTATSMSASSMGGAVTPDASSALASLLARPAGSQSALDLLQQKAHLLRQLMEKIHTLTPEQQQAVLALNSQLNPGAAP